MSLSGILEVAIGLAFIYALLALIASGLNEAIANIVGLRAQVLERGITKMLGKEGCTAFYNHPLISALRKDTLLPFTNDKPSYIPPDLFASVALQQTVANLPAEVAAERVAVTDAINALPDSNPLAPALKPLWATTTHRIDDLRAAVEKWFNAKMDRVGGEYRRLVGLILFLLGVAMAVSLNVDSITVAKVLWQDPVLRSALANAAQQAHFGTTDTASATPAPSPTGPGSTATASAVCNSFATSTSTAGAGYALDCLNGLGLPIGWSQAAGDPRRVAWDGSLILHLIGWLITAAAISLGAPFWFNAMGGMLHLRFAGNPPISPTGPGASAGGSPTSAPPIPGPPPPAPEVVVNEEVMAPEAGGGTAPTSPPPQPGGEERGMGASAA